MSPKEVVRRSIVVALFGIAFFGEHLFCAGIDSQGFIHRWMILGPLGQNGFASPGIFNMRQDYLTDGAGITEETIMPFPGMTVDTDFSEAASTGLRSTPNSDLNPSGKPQWYEYYSNTNTVDFEAPNLYAKDIDELMTYACVYVENLTGAPIEDCRAGVGSDDAIQVLVGDEEVLIENVARGWGSEGEIQDWSGPFTLEPGISRVLVKVFEGGGSTGFRLKFQDGQGKALSSDRLSVSLVPFGPCPEEVEVYVDSWLREVTFVWENRLSNVQIWEDEELLVEREDFPAQELTIGEVSLGRHTYNFHCEIGENEPPCDPIVCVAEMTPVWPADFRGSYDKAGGTVNFSWRNLEEYYEVLKIQENGEDLPGVEYGLNSAQLPGTAEGIHTYTLVAGLAGYKSEGITCQVQVSGSGPLFKRGDANSDGSIDMGDAVFALNFLFAKGDEPACFDTLDANDDGKADLSDPVTILGYLFGGGSALPEPFGACGIDPTPDSLGCSSYPPCAQAQ